MSCCEEVKVKEIPAPEAGIAVPEEIQAKAQQFIDNYVKRLQEQTDKYVLRTMAADEAAEPEHGTPRLAGGYQYWNCLTVGPIQFGGPPPWQPSRIIAAGDLALMLGVVWVNPALGPGGSLPGTTVLSTHSYRVRFETVNLSDVANGPDHLWLGNFTAPAPVISVFPWYFVPADPGPNPNLYETYLTADITTPAFPFAAFATWHQNPDLEPPFLSRPAVPPWLWQYDIPARFLVYRR